METHDLKDKIDIVKSSISLIFYLSILVGAILSLYFYIYVGALPTIENIAQFAMYFIAIASVSLFMIILFFLFIVSPSLVVKVMGSSENNNKIIVNNYIFATILILVGLSLSYSFPEKANIFAVVILLLVWFGIPCLSSFISLEKIFDAEIFQFSFIQLVLFSVISILFLTFYLPVKNNNFIDFLYMAFIYFVVILFFNIFLLFTKKIKNNFFKKPQYYIFVLIILYFLVSSMIFVLANKPNIFIIRPFQMFSLGYYNHKFYYTEEFAIQNSELFEDKNKTSLKFFILSNIGKEYIAYRIFDKNETIDKRCLFGIEKENPEKIRILRDNNISNEACRIIINKKENNKSKAQ